MRLLDAIDDAQRADRLALHSGAQRWTYGELRGEIDRLAGGLRALGVRAGERVGLMFLNRPENLFAIFACWRIGAVAVLVRPEQAGRNAVSWWQSTGTSCVLVDDELVPLIAPYAAELAATAVIVSTGATAIGPHVRPWSVVVGARPRAAADHAIDGEAPAVIVQTSGTTSVAKAVWFSRRAIDARLAAHQAFTPARADDVGCVLVAPAHVVQLFVLAIPPLHAGGQLVLIRQPTPAAILAEIVRRRVTILGGPPMTMFDLLDAARGAPELDLSALRRVWTGADTMPASLHRAWSEVFATPLLDGYGLSETAAGVLVNPSPEDNRPGTVGRPFPTVEIRLVAPGGVDVPDGEPGELWCRCAYLFGGYWNAPERMREVMVDGWLRTGDQAVRDPDGRYRILGRTGALFKHRAAFVSPYEVEAALRELPAIVDCLVAGMPRERVGHEPEAFVVLGAPVGRAELHAFVASRLAESSRPVRYWSVARLPYTAQGKLDRDRTDALRATATAIT